MKFIPIEQPYFIKLAFTFIPLFAAAAWYGYVAHPWVSGTQFIEHFFSRAQKLQTEGNVLNAKQEYLNVLEHDPDCAAAHFNLAQMYAGDNQWDQACTHYKPALKNINPKNKHLVHFCYGTALFRLEKLKPAKKQLDASIALCPTTKAIMQRSLVALALGDLTLARDDLDIAVESDKSYARGYIEIGNKYRDQQQFKKARDCYQACIKHMPEFYGPYLLCGDVLNLLGKQTNDPAIIAQAKSMYEKTIELNPTCYEAKLNLGLMYMEQNDDETALELFAQAYAHNPDFKLTNVAKGICHIKRGEFAQGWPGYEWRTKFSPTRFDHLPRWNGKESLKNKKIILHAEQGYGDTFHFIRFAQIAHYLGAYVIVEVQDRLKHIISLCPYIDQLIIFTDTIPACDYQLPLLSMPTVLQTTLETIPKEIPYLYANPDLIAHWRTKLARDTNFKIGVCWSVDSSHDFTKYSSNNVEIKIDTPCRAINFEQLKPLAQLKNVSVYSLMINSNQEQCHAMNIKTFENLDKQSGPFMDTAAIMKNLDLIITVDTSLAHLAGGLGVPTWIMLPFPAEWRWMKDRTDSPWYPTARLYRSTQSDDWNQVIERMVTDIRTIVNEKNKGSK